MVADSSLHSMRASAMLAKAVAQQRADAGRNVLLVSQQSDAELGWNAIELKAGAALHSIYAGSLAAKLETTYCSYHTTLIHLYQDQDRLQHLEHHVLMASCDMAIFHLHAAHFDVQAQQRLLTQIAAVRLSRWDRPVLLAIESTAASLEQIASLIALEKNLQIKIVLLPADIDSPDRCKSLYRALFR
ncbi:hypothetical protein [Undibacterium sp. RuTC16W]|uniref:hypothetical protein n=1 Tax=Undibacterium sp. RuTC16W TaxID=3413048 RepID=UPI003BEFF2A0